MTPFAGSDLPLQITYLIAATLFILSLKWMSSPSTARRGVWAGEVGMLLAILGTLLHHGIADYQWIAIGLVLGSIIGSAAGSGAHDGRAAADGAEPCIWRVVRHAGRNLGILFARAACAALHDVCAFGGSDSGLADFYGKPDGGGKAGGSAAAAADHVQGPEFREFRSARNCGGGGNYSGAASGAHAFVSGDAGDSADFRRADDRADRRRGHAHRDVAAEFVRGTFGRGDGIRAG